MPTSQTKIKLMTVSRLTKEKRIDILIKMIKNLEGRFSLTVVGEGTERHTLEKLTKQLDVADKVIFVGWKNQEEQVEMYHRHHLFLSASNFETFGLTYVEALVTGTPCAVYDYPVGREVIPSGTSEFISSSDPQIWAEHIRSIFQNKKDLKMRNMIKKKYSILSNFSSTKSTKALLEVYKKILSSTHSKIS